MGTLGIYSILITNQERFLVEDTTNYFTIPNVSSGLEEVKNDLSKEIVWIYQVFVVI